MRVAYVCADPGVPVFGQKGCSVHVQEVCRALLNAGADLHLFATRVGGEPPPGLSGVPVHPLPPLPKGDVAARERAALAANAVTREVLESAGPFDLVYERYSLWSFAGMEYAAATGKAGLLEVNAPLVEEQAAYRGLADREAAESIERRTFGAAAAVVAVSDDVAAHVRRTVPRHPNVHVVPNAVDPDRFRPGVEPAVPRVSGAFTVGFVGTMKPWHGLPVLVEAFALLRARAPHARLLLVGDGTARADVESDLLARGLTDATTITGAVAPAAVPAMLASMDVAVAPYPALERFYFSPLKLYEYMAAGLAVVASRVGPIERVIRHGTDGLLVPPGDAAALAEALTRLATDPSLAAGLGRAARERVAREHTWDSVARQILSLAASAAPSRPRVPTAAGAS